MMSQNRQSAKDRLAADLEYQLNLKLEMQLQELHLKLDELKQLVSLEPATYFSAPQNGPNLVTVNEAHS